MRRVLREALRHCLDMKRAVQRLSLGRGGPKDLYDLAATLKVIPALKDAVLSFQHYQTDSVYSQPPLALAKLANGFFDHSALLSDIERMLLTNARICRYWRGTADLSKRTRVRRLTICATSERKAQNSAKYCGAVR